MKRTAWLAAALMAGTLVPLGGRLAGDLSGTALAAAASSDAGPNPIVLENQKPGDAGSQITGYVPTVPEPGHGLGGRRGHDGGRPAPDRAPVTPPRRSSRATPA